MRQILLLIILCFAFYGPLSAQVNVSDWVVTYRAMNKPLGQVLKELSDKYAVQFFYSTSKIPVDQPISINIDKQPLSVLLNEIKSLAAVDYKINGSKIILFADIANAQPKHNFSVYGFVEDSLTGERLIGANIIVKDLTQGTVTNAYGYYSLPLQSGDYIIKCSSIGYFPVERRFKVDENIYSGFKLQTNLQQLQEIKVAGKLPDNISSVGTSNDHVSLKMLQTFPALFGENDPIQFLKMLPGVQSANEGSNGLYVRGSTPGQTAFLLDDAPLFNISHISGFFSSINPDAVKDIHIYKSHVPAKYGSVLGSAVDVRLRDGNNQHFSVTGAIGTISSRLTVEGPIIKNKASYIVSARRSYLTQVLQLFNDGNSSDVGQIYFYDVIGKINYMPNTRNRFYLSAYLSKDNAKVNNEGMDWGNSMLSFRWNYVFSSKLFSNLTLTGSSYVHQYDSHMTDYFTVRTNTQNYALKYDLSYYPKEKLQVNFGLGTNYQAIFPIEINVKDNAQIISPYNSEILNRSLYNIYADISLDVTSSLTIETGVLINYIHNYSLNKVTPSLLPEPFLLARYKLSPVFSVKAAYSRNSQSYFTESVINMILPFDVLIFANGKIKPQFSDNFTLGCYYTPTNGKFEVSLETYYKSMYNQQRFMTVDDISYVGNYKDSSILGSSRSYGVELSLRKYIGKLNGLIGYTLSKVTKKEEQLFNGKPYRPYYDRPHQFSIILHYQFSKRFSSMLSWTYLSGGLYNMPTGKYEVDGISVPVYELETYNTLRMPAYHHLDIGMQYKFNSKRRYQHKLSLNFYNVYFRENPQFYTFRDVYNNDISKTDLEGVLSKKFSALGFYIFQFVPAFSYEFKF